MSKSKRRAVSKVKTLIRKTKKAVCPFHSRAWGVRCELDAGHDGLCCNAGDCFAPGYDPKHPEREP